MDHLFFMFENQKMLNLSRLEHMLEILNDLSLIGRQEHHNSKKKKERLWIMLKRPKLTIMLTPFTKIDNNVDTIFHLFLGMAKYNRERLFRLCSVPAPRDIYGHEVISPMCESEMLHHRSNIIAVYSLHMEIGETKQKFDTCIIAVQQC